MEWLHLPLKRHVVYLRASNAKIAFAILTGGEIASSVECAMGDKPPLFLGEPVHREKGRCGQVNDPLSRGRRGVAAAVIAETSCCRLQEAKEKEERERVGARADRGEGLSRGRAATRSGDALAREERLTRPRSSEPVNTYARGAGAGASMQVARKCRRANLLSLPSLLFLSSFLPSEKRRRGAASSSRIYLREFCTNPGLLTWVKIHPAVDLNASAL